MLNKRINKKGKFITFEGIDGSGKSTQIKKLKSFLKTDIDSKYFFTREPGGTSLGDNLRKILLSNENNNLAEVSQILLMVAARYEHYEKVIIPNIKKNNIIISDRYQDSTYVYQCGNNKVLQKVFLQFNTILFNNFEPDLTILLDVSPKVAFERISKRKDNNRYDKKKLSFYQSARNSYLLLSKNNKRFKVINADLSPDIIFKNIQEVFFKEELI